MDVSRIWGEGGSKSGTEREVNTAEIKRLSQICSSNTVTLGSDSQVFK